jgi:GR25 family glycosyltransferase involved in LPS biosynthesis
MEGIDFIYMINLDQRPEKFEQSIGQLALWGIEPYRFSAVNGWELSLDTVTAVGVKYNQSMTLGKTMVTYYSQENWKTPMHEYPNKKGRAYFCHKMSLGNIGICLSHLSVLQDALDSGYETIWVMEDDIEVIRSPHLLPDFIQKLDEVVGKDGWDILFTDQDTKGRDGKYVICLSYAPRLNFTPSNKKRFARRYDITPEIRSVGARYGAYSMIVRRSGMEKLLSFFKKYNLFLPYDMDFFMPDDIRIFSIIDDVVSTKPNALSDNSKPRYTAKQFFEN